MSCWWLLQADCTSSIIPIRIMSKRSATFQSKIQIREEGNWSGWHACDVGRDSARAKSDQIPVHGDGWTFQRVRGQLFSTAGCEWDLQRSLVRGAWSRPGLLSLPKRSVISVGDAGSGGR